MIELTSELLQMLLDWQKIGKRSFEIKVSDIFGQKTEVWVFDLTVMGGFFINKNNINKDWLELIKKEKKAGLVAQLAAMENE